MISESLSSDPDKRSMPPFYADKTAKQDQAVAESGGR